MEPEKSKPESSLGSSDKPTNRRSVDKMVSKNTDVIKSPLATNLFGKDSNKVSKLIFVMWSKKTTAVGGSKARKFFSKKANRALEPPSGP